jgi:CBS domain containing-hemolysin-like protein
MTPLLLVLGEVVPKSLFQLKSNTVAPAVVRPIRLTALVLYPAVVSFSRMAHFIVRVAGGGKSTQSVFTAREQLRAVLEMTERASDVTAFERGRIRRVMRFADTLVGEAMTPLAETVVFNRNRSMQDLVRLVRRRGYHRLPIYKGNASNIVGVVTLSPWDLMDEELASRSVSELIQPALYVAQYQTIDQLLPMLRQREDRMAVVVDEFGSAVGVITLEDVLEEVVGDVEVGYSFEEHRERHRRTFEALEEGVYLLDSRLPISEVSDILGTQLPATESRTVGGLLLSRLRRIPRVGEYVIESGYRFTVTEATERAIVRVRVEPEFRAEAPA